MRRFLPVFVLLFCLFIVPGVLIHAQATVTELCPSQTIQPRPTDFKPGGIILTAFDSAALWVYDIDRTMRYPLPETVPCISNCRLSADAKWVSYLDPKTFIYMKMRLNGTERTPITGDAADVTWWNLNTLLVWTVDHRAYLQEEGAPVESREFLQAEGAISIQPGGKWGVILRVQDDGSFMRVMTNLAARPAPGMTATEEPPMVNLAPDTPFFNEGTWSPDGRYLAYVGRGAYNETAQIAGAELFLIQPGGAIPEQVTFFSSWTGAVRIDGASLGTPYWSPDGSKVAFWVIPLNGPDPMTNTGDASIYMLDVNSRQITHYCAFSTGEHTPNPPRLVWSPDSTNIGFAGSVDGDNKGTLLLALNVADGTLTELSDGIAPAPGIPDLVVWGNQP